MSLRDTLARLVRARVDVSLGEVASVAFKALAVALILAGVALVVASYFPPPPGTPR